MTRSVIVSSSFARLPLAAFALGISTSALGQDEGAEVVTDRNPNAMDVAATPIQDLNLTKDKIPEALTDSVIAPYASERLATCEDIRREVLRLDAVLGHDLDIDTKERKDITVGKVAKSAVGSLIPFRGVIREVTGAADHQRDFEEAILAGAIRRGFLKGLGMERGCPYPSRPATTRISMAGQPVVDGELITQWQEAKLKQGTVTFVSKPVVQGESE